MAVEHMVEFKKNMNKQINRLVVFGCSHTEGQYLPDWKPQSESSNVTYSKHCWAELLRERLGVSVVNMARGGNSNHEILLDILNFNFSLSDLAIVCWTYPERSILYTKNTPGNLVRTKSKLSTDEIKAFYLAHDLYDLQVRTVEHVNYANTYLKLNDINYMMACIDKIEIVNDNVNCKDITNFLWFNTIDLGSDNSHPGVESHKNFYKKLVREINV